MTIQKLFIIIAILSTVISYYRKHKNTSDGFLLNFCQYFLGLLFIFSGFVKAIDPLGTSYKMHDYFESFARDGMPALWEQMGQFSVPIAIIMIVAEIVLGFAIIIGCRMRLAAIGLLFINIFFLYLTGYSYLSGYCLTKQAILVPAILLSILFLTAFVKNNKKRWQGLTLMTLLVLMYFLYCK
ncbi:MAG: DoxX family protein, partial [Chitinophagales bacterium]